MVDTRTTAGLCRFQKPIGVVAPNEDAAADIEQRRANPRARHQTSVSMVTGAGCRGENPRLRRREKNVLDSPFYRSRLRSEP